MNELTQDLQEVNRPPRPRKKGSKLKITLIVIAILISLIVCGSGPVFNSWAKSNQRQLQAELDDIAARGEPIYWADLQPDPVPDDQNAALLYLELSNIPLLVGETEESRRLKDIVRGITLKGWSRSEYAEDIAEILRQAQPGLDLCRRARELPDANWGCDYSLPATEIDIGKFNKLNFMSTILCLAALESHEDGDDEKALGYLLDNQRLSRSPYSEWFLIPYLVGRNCNVRLFLALEAITPTLEITAGSAGRVQADIVLANLTDESVVSQAMVQGLIGERCFLFDVADRVKRDEIFAEEIEKPSTRLVRQVIAFNELILVRHATSIIEAAEFGTWPATKRVLPEPVPKYTDPIRSKLYFLVIAMQPTFMNEAYETHYRNLAKRRMAATALAMRMYELDHGARPEALEQLVPQYLTKVPEDPFFDGKRPIAYAPDVDKPVLYSVFLNGIDDHGEHVPYKGTVKYDKSPDLVFFLDGKKESAPAESDEPQTQPVYDDEF